VLLAATQAVAPALPQVVLPAVTVIVEIVTEQLCPDAFVMVSVGE
jgi:hypothetical protein